MCTNALYMNDSYVREFQASVESAVMTPQGIEVILDQSAFYPESGGQPSDQGRLAGLAVFHVFERDGHIVHLCRPDKPDAALPGGSVAGHIDWNRRHDFMQQHCGQHILSAAFDRLSGFRTVGFHLTETHAQIDLDTPELIEQAATQAEELANRIVWSPARVMIHFPDQQALADMPLRKATDRSEGIRVIEVEGFDWSPCGGTHPATAAEVGLIKITGWERQKTVSRVEFLCGTRAISDYEAKNRLLRQIATSRSIPGSQVGDYVERLEDSLRQMKKSWQDARERLLDYEAEELFAASESGDPRVIVADFADRDVDELRNLALRITRNPRTVAILASRGSTARLVLTRAADVSSHMGQICQQIAPLINGRGGGSPQSAQCGGDRLNGLTEAIALARELSGK